MQISQRLIGFQVLLIIFMNHFDFDIEPKIKRLQPSATLAMNELIVARREAGQDVHHLGFGESPFPIFPRIKAALAANAHRKSYLPTQGILQLRKKISEFYETMFHLYYEPQQIIIGPGSKMLQFSALMALEGPLYLVCPSWVSYQHQGRLLNKEVHQIYCNIDRDYLLTPDELIDSIEKNSPEKELQKILILNYPNNPTGYSYSPSQLKEIAAVCREYNIIVISDEIYGLISFSNHEHHSIAEYYPEGTLITGGLSKDRSSGGYRVGVMLVPAARSNLVSALKAIGSETWSCVAAPIQYAAIEAYTPSENMIRYIQDCTKIHEIMCVYFYQQLTQNTQIILLEPKGAFYLYPNWNKYREVLLSIGIRTSRQLSEYLLSNYGVACLPGAQFGMPVTNLGVRLALVDYDGEATLRFYQENKEEVMQNRESFIKQNAPHLYKACENLLEFTKTLEKKLTSKYE